MRSWSISSLSTVALLVLSQPQPPDFAWVVDSVAVELRSRLDDDVIEFCKRSVDLAATVGDAVATLICRGIEVASSTVPANPWVRVTCYQVRQAIDI
ncbi:MAG: hypothetical protein V7K88_23275 [Nostoc sp.]|uniref:hypothetical protein n=1 Tax=Nostoc sp. TaxID=1180 RepID=UPI002FFC7702